MTRNPARADISIILVGFNSRRYLSACLDSLQRTAWGEYTHEIVCVDNGSSDGTVEMLRERYPHVQVIANRKNAGFCEACNQGADATTGRYIYLLNNDTVAFEDSVPSLARFLDERPSAGAAGNRLLNPDMTDQWSARRFPNWLNAVAGRRSALARWRPDHRLIRKYLYKDDMERGVPFEVDWIPGSCTLVRREAFEAVGGLPEGMHYWSDALFCARLRSAGFPCYIVPSARLIHDEGCGTGRKSRETRQWLIYDFHNGAYRFYCEYYGLGTRNPLRWAAKIGLTVRSRLLLLRQH